MSLLDQMLETYRRLKAAKREAEGRLEEVERLAADVEAAAAWVDGLVESLQAAARDRIGGVVSKCLSAVFGAAAYSFRLTFEGKGRVGFEFVRDGQSYSADDQIGGGVLDVAAFALRVVAVCAARPKPAQVLVLDEPFRFVSEGHRPAVAALLQTVAAEFGVQIVMVTHAPELVGGHVVQL